MLGTASNYRQSQTFTKVCLDHGAMINESCTPIPHSMRSDVDLHAASPVAQNKQGRVQDLASKQLSILQCNINGLRSTATKIKLEEIMEIAEKQKIQIIALQETKLNEKYNLKYKNYNILRKDRNKEGGGLAFLIKNLYYEDIAINIPNTSDLEAQGIKVYLNQNKTINIFNMYHPPNNKLIDDGTMAQFLTDNTIIVGDLNAKHQLWGCSTPNPRGKILSNLFDDNAFMCLNDGNPTHHSYSYNTAQALDISFSSPDIFHKCKWQILKSIGSDHLPILIEISTKTKTSSIKEKFWNFKKANWNLYQQNTNEDFRKAPTRIKDLEQNWISFKNTIIKAAKVSIPRGNIKKWIPNYTHQAKDIQTLITKRNELQKKCTQNQTNCRTELNIVNAKIKRLYVNMKREKWKQTCENLNPRNPNTKLWHLAKQIDRAQPQTENTNMIKNTDGTPATNDKNAANLLGNSYQISSKIKFEIKDKKVEKKARKIIHDCKNVTSTHNIFHEKINMKELDYALENTDLNKTPGPDGIHGQMISNLGKNGKEKLLDIFNNSWKTGKLPQDWKTATIIPIKKLDKSADDPKNYRPISLTSICCKLMEKIILRRLTYHLDTRNLLPKEQYGFRKGHGTIDQLLFFTQKSPNAKLNVLQCNINGISTNKSKVKLDEILSLADSKSANIICLQETKLKPNHLFKVKGFKILRKDRPSADGGGELLNLIKDLSFEEIDTPSTTQTQLQAFKIHLPNQRPLTIVNTYHPPQKPGPELDLIAHLLDPNILILGDFNSKHQSWGCPLKNTEGSILSTFIDDNNLTIVSHGPTYISHSYGTPQTLDITITSPSMQQFIKNNTLKSIGSDHLPLLTEISTSTSLPKSSQRLFWNYKKASWNSFETLLDSLLSKIPLNSSLEDRWKNWKSAVLISAKQNIPRGNRKFYILGYREVLDLLKDEIEDRNQVYQDLIENNTLLIRDYNHLAAKIKLKADQIKQNKWIELCSSIDPKTSDTKLWRLLHALNQDTPSHSTAQIPSRIILEIPSQINTA
ncbi:hypothetical protein LAZ67_19002107 [Cordylochernes scorpioides]|uniref:Uncharacterized protein n=1 Tax=Cordylochernes scorpioides TaxID=51811 RepID=A0ABY6LII4_9ARAC|nr:hypothetical protein LAZ67_19002107 [Cordylochernes scorpioides]